jgi:hypothetical protein
VQTLQQDVNSIRREDQTPRLRLANGLNWFRRMVGGDRFENLYGAVESEVASVVTREARLLDYGCGAMSFSTRLQRSGRVGSFVGMDIFPSPAAPGSGDDRWSNYRQLSPAGLSAVQEHYDIAIVLDVLHHAAEDEQPEILRKLGTVADLVLVKDHFEHGFVSRHLLRLADWFGNYAFGVTIPDRYFDRRRWSEIIAAAGLHEVLLKT